MQIKVKLLEGKTGRRPAFLKELKGLRAAVKGAMDTVKRLSLDLRPPMLDDLGVSAAVEWLVKDFCRRAGLRHSVRITPENLDAPPQAGAAIFRILQEALTNVARHAQAGQVRVTLSWDGHRYRLLVEDDGRGFEPDKAGGRSSLGIMGMRERAAACGGSLAIESRLGGGTRVEAEIPAAEGEGV
jgi:hypothetical protein